MQVLNFPDENTISHPTDMNVSLMIKSELEIGFVSGKLKNYDYKFLMNLFKDIQDVLLITCSCRTEIRLLLYLQFTVFLTFIFTLFFTENPLTILGWFSNFGFQAVANAFFSVDTFFFLR